jgi:peptidoglycan/xylan/chitin deacetylase (PgdA/CDA1 family)
MEARILLLHRFGPVAAWVLVLGLAVSFLTFPGPTQGQEVAITFDDLPAHGPLPSGISREDVTRKILAALKEAKVPEVYGFINAGKLEGHSDDLKVLQLWRQAGQPLANHTYDHMSLNSNAAEAFEQNVEKNEAVLEQLMGHKNWHWLRYPYLNEGDTLEKRRAVRAYLKDHHYQIAQVSLDFEDYAWNGPYARCSDKKDEKAIAWLKESYLHTASEYMKLDREMSKQLFHRDIKYVLLMHIGAFDAEMLPELLAQMKRQGVKFITLEKAQKDPAYKIDPDTARPDGAILQEQIYGSRHMQIPPNEKPMKQLRELCTQ